MIFWVACDSVDFPIILLYSYTASDIQNSKLLYVIRCKLFPLSFCSPPSPRSKLRSSCASNQLFNRSSTYFTYRASFFFQPSVSSSIACITRSLSFLNLFMRSRAFLRSFCNLCIWPKSIGLRNICTVCSGSSEPLGFYKSFILSPNCLYIYSA